MTTGPSSRTRSTTAQYQRTPDQVTITTRERERDQGDRKREKRQKDKRGTERVRGGDIKRGREGDTKTAQYQKKPPEQVTTITRVRERDQGKRGQKERWKKKDKNIKETKKESETQMGME